MNALVNHFRQYFLSGLLAVIPIALTLLALGVLYSAVDRRVGELVHWLFGVNVPGLGILAVLVILYLTGLTVTNAVGRLFVRVMEQILDKVPLVRTTYRIGKQLSNTLSLPERQVFKRAILVEYLKPGIWTIGFVTGGVSDQRTGEEYLKVFVPTPPNPTSGTMVLVRSVNTRDPGWTVEEALNTVISGGIIGPTRIV
jgi:uncharacterized membrane protein